ncbi:MULTISPECIES: GntR family transcriptional regulator [unclassified Aureimonas]|uniref:GntR family transcriptional regulator n=1 Tax=unclassified Aureimonas TaxID=2615206 RepID=UPI0006FB7E7C|nr:MULTISPECIES: GntR family transcriptional regulator [unclassified Aureimonas]KQT64036.1 GntR family transcriptional regulator [Aureimonas sp. Leaf427]KQT81229.1 GntR family transcriptional regulator [Aureimonas sp. Leaf460]
MTSLLSSPLPRVPSQRLQRRVTTATQIFEVLKSEIIASRLQPGLALQDRMLTERFGVSRTPVREALIRLSEIGLVDIFPQAGTFVSRVPVGAIPEAVVIRKALEGVTVEAAALSQAPDREARLAAIIRRQKAMALVGDIDAFHEADEAFHAELAEIANHPGIWTLLKQVKVQIDRARRMTLPVLGRMDHVIAEHEAIADHVVAGDAVAARAAMMDHLNAVIPDVAELRGLYPDYFA